MSDHLSTQELIRNIERSDRRFRLATQIFLVLIGLALCLVLYLQFQALEQFKQQSADRSAEIKQLQEENKAESEKSNRYLRCIATYFANPDRGNTVIQSIEDCNIDPTTGAFVPGVEQPIASNPTGSSSLTPGSANPEPSNNNTNPGGGQGQGNPGGNNGSENTPERNFVQRNITDPLLKFVDDSRAIIGL